jgi:hypothetical protein
MPDFFKFFNKDFFSFTARFLFIISISLLILFILAPYAPNA